MDTIVSEVDLARAKTETGWTDARLSVARALFVGGQSAAQIAVAIGGTTRNAVIGVLHRRGTKRGIQPRAEKRRPSPRAAGLVRRRTSRHAASPAERPAPVIPVDDGAIPVEQRRSLVELDGDCCHWPVGDPGEPGFFFCGAVARGNDPYCPAHMHRAIAPPGAPRPYRSKESAGRVNNAWFR